MLSRKYDARFLEKGWWDKALSWCRGQGAHAIILWATPGGRSLYRRCGFAEPADVLELRYAAHLPRSPVRRRS